MKHISSMSWLRSASRSGARPSPQLASTTLVVPCDGMGSMWGSHHSDPS